jgi:excisionase family DNA binding protein
LCFCLAIFFADIAMKVRKDASVTARAIPDDNGEMKMADNALAYTVAEACAIARTGKTALYLAIKSGELPAYKRGRRTLVRPADLRHWVDGLPLIETKSKALLADRKVPSRSARGEPAT